MSRPQLKQKLIALTSDFFTEGLVLNKPNYKAEEQTQIMLDACITYHSLPLVDEVKAQILKGKTNMSTELFRQIMRDAWAKNVPMHTHLQRDVFIRTNAQLSGQSIGRNQAIDKLFTSVKESIHVEF